LHPGEPRSGDGKFPGSNLAALHKQLTAQARFADKQCFEVTDTGTSPQAMRKETIESAIKDFLAASRGQDRILVVFAGHACDIEKKSYLVPSEGNKDDAKTLIPLRWLY